MHVFGSDKWIEIRNATHPDTPGGEISYVEAETGTPHVETTYQWNDAVVANLEAFHRAAAGEIPYPFTLDEMVHNIEVLEAITLSASDRRTVRIDSL
ncbi:MAG: Gfo/Idh/MocA family oxidoreductase [Geminicoccaceae bacterium]